MTANGLHLPHDLQQQLLHPPAALRPDQAGHAAEHAETVTAVA